MNKHLLGSITRDENPLGVNQYSGAAAHAGKLSAAAIKGDKGKDNLAASGSHMAASRAHLAAAKLTENSAMQSWHKSMALAHAHNAAAHAANKPLPYKFGRNFGDNPQPTR